MNFILMSQDELDKKWKELNAGKEYVEGDLDWYVWACGPIEQGATLEAALPACAEYACVVCGMTEVDFEPGEEKQFEHVAGFYFALVKSGAARNRDDGNKEFLLANLWDVWTHVGAARDNDEPVDCDWVQKVLAECKEVINS